LLRASDADREQATDLLRENAAAGRLTLSELEQRVQSAIAATTRAELARLLADLPEPAGPADEHKPRRWFGSLFGSSSRRPQRLRLRRRVVSIAVMASPGIDLCYAELSAPETVMYAFSLFGWPDIYLPDSVGLELTGFTLFGGDAERGSTAAPAPGAPVVKVRAYSFIGGYTVWRLPSQLQGLPHGQARKAARALRARGAS
jgi:hypothetical protein